MKKNLILLASLMLVCSAAYAQDYTRNGKEYTAVQKSKETKEPEKTGFTWKDSKGNVYDIYISSRNACYIIKTSKKTGKQYKQYLPKELSQDIAHQLGRDNTVDYE